MMPALRLHFPCIPQLVLILHILDLGVLRAHTSTFEVSGILEHVVYHGPRNPAKLGHFTNHFSVTVDGGRYFIRFAPDLPEPGTSDPYIDVGFDGTLQYVYKKSGLSKVNDQDIVDIGMISENPIPTAKSDVSIPILWFALASGALFRDGIPDEFPALWFLPMPEQYQSRIKFRLRSTPIGGPFLLPKTATFWCQKEFAYDPIAGVLELQLAPPFDKGYSIATYAVDSEIQYGAIRMPKEATYSQHGLSRSNSIFVDRTLYSDFIKVTNMSDRVGRTSFMPLLLTRINVSDSRIKDKPISAVYLTTNWPAFDTPLVQYQIKKAEEGHRNFQLAATNVRSERASRVLFFFVVAASACAAVGLWLRNREIKQIKHLNKPR